MTGTTARRGPRLLRGIGAAIILAAVVVGVPVLLTTLMPIVHVTLRGVPSVHDVMAALRRRDDGQLVAGVLVCVAWICWALFTISLLPEIAAVARKRPAVPLPGLGAFQGPAGVLVAAVAIGFAFAPLAATSHPRIEAVPPLPKAHAAAVSTVPAAPPTVASNQPSNINEHSHVVDDAAARPLPASPGAAVPTYVVPTYQVQRRDTLWGIAERYLRDPLRYPEIVSLNADELGPDNEITPGTVLTLPADATGLPRRAGNLAGSSADVTVQPGDTLWGLAERITGDGANWQQAWHADAGTVEPDGTTFTDPNLIRPGWTLRIPTPPGSMRTVVGSKPAKPEPPVTGESITPTPTPSAIPPLPATSPATTTAAPIAPTPTNSVSAAHAGHPAAAADRTSRHSTDSSVSALGGLAGLMLAGVSLTALTRYRRRQFRRRRPGRMISGTRPGLIGMERAVRAAGRAGVADVTWLDQALRGLVQAVAAEPGGRLPDVIAACVGADELTLVLSGPAPDAPSPWRVDETCSRWSIQRCDQLTYDPARRSHYFAPYPTLTSVGYTPDGEHWLLDLESIGSLSLTGDADRCLNLARFLAAELAHNPWSEMLRVTLVGFGHELVEANPDRLTYTEDQTSAVQSADRQIASVIDAMRSADVDVLTGRLRDIVGDAWAPSVVLIAPHLASDTDGLDRLLETMKQQGLRTSVALVLADDPRRDSATRWRLHIAADGVLSIPRLGVELIAEQVPAGEAAQLAQMLAWAAVSEDEPVPAAHGDQPWDEYADACGGLTVETPTADETWAARFAQPDIPLLHLADEKPCMADSVLPLPPQTYIERAATTAEDLRALAPIVDDEIRARAERADTELDDDLKQWMDPDCPRPKVTLLGRVTVRAQGRLPERSPQEPFHTEVVAYLATALDGVPSNVYAEMMWPSDPDVVGKSKVRQSIMIVRKWLGRDPETGDEYLPSGLHEVGAARYRVTGALIDAELFRRLRVRGESRGRDGITDLWRALNLVQGRPFSDITVPRGGAPGGYGWMTEANRRLDHEYSVMIVDTAHTLAIHHFGAGEPELAAKAAQVSLLGGTYEDVPLLDLVRACLAQEKEAEAEAWVQQILSNNNVDEEVDLPPRTAEVLFRLRRQWRAS